jgi:hypothetical protein
MKERNLMKWEVVKRDDLDQMLAAVERLRDGEVVLITSNGTKHLEKTRSSICMRAKARGLAITTKKIDKDHLEVTRAAG